MFTHLHVHTEYSMLDGFSKIGNLVQRASEHKMHSLAITDHGGLYGAIDFYKTSIQAGIKPIIGCEMYVAPGSRHDKNPNEKTPFHMTVLAKDNQGYKNLIKLVSDSHLEGFYYRPRIDRELLEQYNEGLIVLSGCPSGEIPSLISQGRFDEAKQSAIWYRDLFPEYHLELMEHGGVDQLPAINKGLFDIHKDLGIPLVATNDSHYVVKEHARLHDILVCIHTNTNVNDERRLRMTEDSYYLKSTEEMEAIFSEVPDAISNTNIIAEMCNLDLDFSEAHLPQYKLDNGLSADEYLTQLCYEGLSRRIPGYDSTAKERLDFELDVIKQTKFADYFLVVWDIFRFTKTKGILSAVRGSAAGSLILFCLDVTDVNPLSYRIVFERFLNIERKELPDIDMDFQDDRRGEVLDYVVSKYGSNHVAQIITFGTLGAKGAVRDVGRALDMPYSEVDRIARMVPARLNISLDEALSESTELQEVYEADSTVTNLLDTAKGLEGTIRNAGTHAAGVVISEEPLDVNVPVQKATGGGDGSIAMTQYSMAPVAELGLLKFDFLGLTNLTILAKALDLISEKQGFRIELEQIPLDDAKAFSLLARGDTVGIFQMESSGMTRHIKELKPSSVSDVAAMIALYRPGPMEHIETFIDAKHGRAQVKFPHETLIDILADTHGVIVYQDQVFFIARDFAGYTLGEADILRKAMGKKVPEIMAQERKKFIQGALNLGHSLDIAGNVFDLIEPFAGYGFAKAHAVSYGLISYWTAYFKANYTVEYMACLMNSYAGNRDRIATAVAECERLDITVLPPSINHSGVDFTVDPNENGRKAVRFGLSSIKNVGSESVRGIVESRKEGVPFESLEVMCRNADCSGLTKKTMESLIKAGAFDDLGLRGGLIESIDRILSLAHSESSLKNSDQTSMFDLFGESVEAPLSHINIPEVELSSSQCYAWEIELMGVALTTESPLMNLVRDVSASAVTSASQINDGMRGDKIVLAGQVANVAHRTTRENKPFIIATIALLDSSVEVFVWHDRLTITQGLWEQGKLLTIEGTVRIRHGEVSISCIGAKEYVIGSDIEPVGDPVELDAERGKLLTNLQSRPSGLGPNSDNQRGDKNHGNLFLKVKLYESDNLEDDRIIFDDVTQVLLENRGESKVYLDVVLDGRIVSMEWPIVTVNLDSTLESDLKKIIGSRGEVMISGNAG